MSNILNSKDFGLKIYNRFPPKYREDDAMHSYALKRYLQSLSDGGFAYSIDEMNGILDLIDPIKVDAKLLPVLFKQYGLEVFNGIPEEYLRYLLPNLGEAWSKKGSTSVVEFVTSSLSGIKTSTQTTYTDDNNPLITVKLEMDYSLGDYFPDVERFSRLLTNFIPFYCDTKLIYSYVFNEKQVLNSVDKEFMYISEAEQQDSGVFNLENDDLIKDFISFITITENAGILPTENESGKVHLKLNDFGKFNALDVDIPKGTNHYEESNIFNLEDYFDERGITEKSLEHSQLGLVDNNLDKFGSTPMQDTQGISGEDYHVDKFIYVYHEEAKFSLILESGSANQFSALLGEAIIGKAILGVEHDYADYHEDVFLTE